VRLTLEVIGGFTGPARKQVINLDLARLPSSEAARLSHEIDLIPKTAWGASFFSSSPKPWDFRYSLSIEDTGTEKSVSFHRNQGPPELTRLSEEIVKLNPCD